MYDASGLPIAPPPFAELKVVDFMEARGKLYPFTVDRFIKHKHTDGTLHDGYSIRLHNVDAVDCVGGDEAPFQAWYMGGRRVMVRFPTDSAAGAHAAAAAGKCGYSTRKPRILEDYNVQRNEMLRSDDGKYMYYLFEMPPPESGRDLGLDNNILSPGALNGKIKVDPIPVEYNVKRINPLTKKEETCPQFRTHLVWDICITEPSPRTEQDAKLTNEIDGAITGSFGGMRVSAPSP